MVLTALVTAFYPLVFYFGDFEKLWGSVKLSLVLLVLSCPCALVMAAPIATMTAISLAAANGIIIKDASVLDSLPNVNCVGLDKTGTLTQGRCRVVFSMHVGPMGKEQVHAIMTAVEK